MSDKKEYELVAIPSGDHESFCFDVSRKDFIKITGVKPDNYDKSFFHPNKFRIYPRELFTDLESNKKYKFKIVIEEV